MAQEGLEERKQYKMAQENIWLVSLEEYIKAGVHIGTKIKNKQTKKFIARIRSDGLAIIDVIKLDERLRLTTKLLSKYEPYQILAVGRRETARKPLQMLNKYTGINVYPKRYPPGLLTNPALDIFKDVDVVIITDPILDRNALLDAYRTGKITIAFVDTNNSLSYIDIAIPANNRGAKSLALLYYIIAREYLRNRGLLSKRGELPISYEEFMEKGLEEEEE
ncbi:30S ribosomal protein S2 [Candidatus Nanobsidianus stetteri]|jgi:small subunit ribosomal protein S2|uniref:Small ribosomal subunit protein uS2 n=1 Tax=Nanobsidianus stetteri TaxID=1294122 RepID=A0A2T9WME4_NANST|nr:30S ribosomal protein S2 [Candidatus Nanobsidianus stetteri]MCC5446946.1 30S ribosomal protein S2 [Candidatus Nanobsidianus stetteri]PVU71538.1 30S ribosomal protein S2 [Candidatus Nanobsidianus stetteri]